MSDVNRNISGRVETLAALSRWREAVRSMPRDSASFDEILIASEKKAQAERDLIDAFDRWHAHTGEQKP